MTSEPSQTLHTVVITDIRDETTRARVAYALEKVTRNISREKIHSRLNKLPWTLTRKATPKRAARLYRLLDRLGATVKVMPPLPMAMISDMEETQILPGAHMLSETQIASATQFMSVPSDEPYSAQSQRGPSAKRPAKKPEAPALKNDPDENVGFIIEPMTLGGIMDRGFQICREHFWKLFAIAGIPWMVGGVLILMLVMVSALIGFNIHWLGSTSKKVLILLGVAIVPSVLVIVIGLFYLSQGAMIHAVSSIYLGREVRIGSAYRFVISILVKYMLTSMLLMLTIFGLILTIVIISGVFYFLFAQLTSSGWWSAVTWLPLALLAGYIITKLLLFDKVVIIEDIAYTKALSRSWNLLTGKAEGVWPSSYWVRFSLLISIFVLINITISLIFKIPATVLKLTVPHFQLAGNILEHILSNIGNVVAGLFNSVCMVVFYYDIRNRKEGFDLKMLSTIDRVTPDID